MNLILQAEDIYKEEIDLSPLAIKTSIPLRTNPRGQLWQEGPRPAMVETKLETHHDREKT